MGIIIKRAIVIRKIGFNNKDVYKRQGGAIKGNRIDVAFMTRKEALKFGRKTLTIKIYGK